MKRAQLKPADEGSDAHGRAGSEGRGRKMPWRSERAEAMTTAAGDAGPAGEQIWPWDETGLLR